MAADEATQGAEESHAPDASSPLADLQEPLLREVFFWVNQDSCPSLRLVCKRWKAVLDSLHWVWNPFNVQLRKLCSGSAVEAEATCRELQRLLAANASIFTSIEVAGTPDQCTMLASMDWDIAEFLYILDAATKLTSLTMSCPVTAPTLRAIAGLRSLNELHLQPGSTVPLGWRLSNIERATNCLTELPNLEALELCCSALPASIVDVATKLTRLTELRLCYGAPLPPSITELTALSRLECLVLCEGPGSYAPVASWPGVLNMPQLSHSMFQGLRLAWAAALLASPFPRGSWPAMVSLGLSTDEEDEEDGSSSGRQLETLCLSNAVVSSGLLQVVQQQLDCHRQLVWHPRLGVANLRTLELSSCSIETDWPAAVVRSGAGSMLEELELSRCFPGEEWEAAGGDCLGAAVSQLTALTRLSIEGSKVLPSTLAAITNLQQLRELNIVGQPSHGVFISELPEGPCLSNLRYLTLSHNRFKAVPACLAAATQLWSLDMSFNQQLLVTAEAVDILAGLPLLSSANFSKCCSHKHGDKTMVALIMLGRKRPDIRFWAGRGQI